MTQQYAGGDQTCGWHAELRELLTRDPHFASLDGETLAALVDACEVEEVAGGTCIARAGQAFASLLGVLHGGLRIVRYGKDGTQQTIRELYRGDMLGVMGLLSDRPFPVALFAVRDSTLLRLPRVRFLALAQRHSQLLLMLARLMSERAFDVLEAFAGDTRLSPSARGGNLAILPLSLDRPVIETKDLLIGMVLDEQPAIRVDAALVEAALGEGAADSDGDDAARVTAWLSNIERARDVVLYECDPRLPAWTARCKRQSDRLVIIAAADHPPARAIGQAIARTSPDELSRPIDLVLVHPAETRVPSATRVWTTLPDLRAIHHVRNRKRSDLARVVRRLVGRPTGLVLSGGGARGIAHVGVIAALAEAGIPIDYVCGTSMGAIFGAGLALGWDSDTLRDEVRELFAKPFALYDLTLPISSLLAGKKLDRVLHQQFGDADIEDLWLPFFCVSTDLARAKLVVHERGSLWKSVRASCSIPGIFPPVPFDGRTLVDGGLVDNLPLDLLVERCSGPIIAVDVFPYGDPGFTRPSGRIARLLRRLRTRVRGEQASPPLFDILVRSTLVGSKFRQQVAMSRADDLVYLEPPVAEFGALQWRSHLALFEAGHQYAKHELARQRARFPMAEESQVGVGGPFQRAECAAHVEPLRRLIPALIAITWVPMLLLALAQWLMTGRPDPLLGDLSVHARLLVALPLFVVGERLLDRLAAVTTDRLFDEGFIPATAVPRARALLARIAHWRDAALPEGLLLVAALLSGVASLVGVLPAAGAIHGVIDSHYTATRVWYGLASLPLFQFLLWHSLFRWALWIRVLIGLSRLPLQLVPAHADRHAGIGFVKFPTLVYCSLMLLAVSSVLCAGWATQMKLYGARLESFKPLFFGYVLIALLIAVAPLLVFMPQLVVARIVGRRQYGGLVTDYTRRFHERWLESDDRFGFLGTPHIQSLADLGTSYRENIEQMHALLFTSKDALVLLVAAFIPTIPLLFLQSPAHEVIKRILHLFLGGTPL